MTTYEAIKLLIEDAHILFCNEYEAALISQKTGWTSEEILSKVNMRVMTLGAKGSRIDVAGQPAIEVFVPAELRKADPTGVGDAYRGGFLAGMAWGLTPERCGQIGSLLATYVVETIGTQEYEVSQRIFLERFEAAYGEVAAKEIAAHIKCSRP